jgi:hypothetical protein
VPFGSLGVPRCGVILEASRRYDAIPIPERAGRTTRGGLMRTL